MKQDEKAFTIVELLVVIVVIAILASISVVAYNGVTARAKSVANRVGASEVVKKVELWNGFLGSYPSYGQLITNSISPTQSNGVYTAGGAAGPPESKLSPNIIILQGDTGGTNYPAQDKEFAYLKCTGATIGGYIIYRDPLTANGMNASPYGVPGTLLYGSGPNCTT